MPLFPGAVLAVVAGEVLDMAVTREHKGVIHRAVHEETVVAHDDDATDELREVFLENLKGGDVQVIGRLIQDEEVGLGHQHHCQIKATTLSAAQLGDVLLLVLWREQEVVKPSHGGVVMLLVEVDVLGHITHRIDYAFALVKVHSLLAIVGKFHCLADFKVAAVGLDDIEQQLDECGLAHAVVTHNTQFLVAGEGVIEIVENHFVAEALVHMVSSEDLLADVGTLDVQFHLAVVAPLLGATWDQTAPFNDLSPYNYFCGCMATAAGQELRYWRWPYRYEKFRQSTHGVRDAQFNYSDFVIRPNGLVPFNWDKVVASAPNPASTPWAADKEATYNTAWLSLWAQSLTGMGYKPGGSGGTRQLAGTADDYWYEKGKGYTYWNDGYEALWAAVKADQGFFQLLQPEPVFSEQVIHV